MHGRAAVAWEGLLAVGDKFELQYPWALGQQQPSHGPHEFPTSVLQRVVLIFCL